MDTSAKIAYGNRQHVLSRDYDDVFNRATVFQCNDMGVASTKKIVVYDRRGEWQEQIIASNAAGETVYVISEEATTTPPSWVPSDIVSLVLSE